jgi:hypothetical protein
MTVSTVTRVDAGYCRWVDLSGARVYVREWRRRT